jgi:hypothetical protein
LGNGIKNKEVRIKEKDRKNKIKNTCPPRAERIKAIWGPDPQIAFMESNVKI